MMYGRLSSVIYADQVPVFDGAMECAEEFLLTAAGQKNRNHLEGYVQFEDVSFGMEEVLYDHRRREDYCLLYQKHRRMNCVKSCKKQVFQLLS